MLNVLFWGLTASPVALPSFMEAQGSVNCNFWSKKRKKKNSAVFFILFSVIKNLDPYPDPDSLEMLDLDPYPDLDSMNPDPQPRLRHNNKVINVLLDLS
jgi:hypothetical protein